MRVFFFCIPASLFALLGCAASAPRPESTQVHFWVKGWARGDSWRALMTLKEKHGATTYLVRTYPEDGRVREERAKIGSEEEVRSRLKRTPPGKIKGRDLITWVPTPQGLSKVSLLGSVQVVPAPEEHSEAFVRRAKLLFRDIGGEPLTWSIRVQGSGVTLEKTKEFLRSLGVENVMVHSGLTGVPRPLDGVSSLKVQDQVTARVRRLQFHYLYLGDFNDLSIESPLGDDLLEIEKRWREFEADAARSGKSS